MSDEQLGWICVGAVLGFLLGVLMLELTRGKR